MDKLRSNVEGKTLKEIQNGGKLYEVLTHESNIYVQIQIYVPNYKNLHYVKLSNTLRVTINHPSLR